MNLAEIIRVLSLRSQFRSRYKWTRQHVLSFQSGQLDELRRFAYKHSDFYRQFHKGLESAPLSQLPVLTKRMLMNNWDDVVTDKLLKLDEVKPFIETLREPELFKRRYYINSTSGSSGLKGIFAYNKEEWRHVLASYSRVYDWAGINIGLFRHYKVAVVSSLSPWHQSAVVGYTAKSSMMQTLRLDSTHPIAQIVSQLNAFKPEVIIAYANMANVLAQQQLSGNLRLTPEVVICASEVLTNQSRKRIANAWGIQAFNTYGATETAGIASETKEHSGLKVFDDLVIVENVDDNYQPVKAGNFGSKLLVTVLFSRTIPLIRYELDDSVCLANSENYSLLPFSTIAEIQGRHEEIITMKGDKGVMTIQPNFFHNLFENAEINEWQIQYKTDNTLNISLLKPVEKAVVDKLRETVTSAFLGLGISQVTVYVNEVENLQRTALGKTYLIKSIT